MSKLTKIALTGAITAGLFLSAVPVSAAALSTAQINSVISLLTAFGVDTTTISTVEATLKGETVTVTPSSATTTVAIVTVDQIGYLHRGANSRAVLYLQTLLAADPSIYPEGVISGYFGQLTENALKRFQKKSGIDQVGFVGPQTLAALKKHLDDNPLGENEDEEGDDSHGKGKSLCAIVPPGHLIAPGWLKKHDGERPEVPECQKLPPGIAKKIGGTGSTTPPSNDTTAPVISSVAAGSITATSAVVTWTTNENATGSVKVGTTNAYGVTFSQGGGLVMSHSVTVTGLLASTMYHFMVESIDAANNSATSSDMTFTTAAAPDTTAPVISSAAVGSITATSAQVTWGTNEAASSKVYYSTVTPVDRNSAPTVYDTTLVTSHTSNLTGLATSTTYYYVIESADAANNTASTTEASFATTS